MSCDARFLPDPAQFELALDAVPGWREDVVSRRFEPMQSGGINANWHVRTARGEFVLRFDPGDERGRELGIDRVRERMLQGAAAEAGLAPAWLASAVDLRWMVRAFIPGRVWTAADFDSPEQLRRLGARLALLHALPVPALPRFDPIALIEGYAARLTAQSPVSRAMLDADIARCRHLLDASGSTTRAAAIIHSDLHGGNIVDDGQLWLLDWEYAQIGDPLCDLAGLTAHHPPLGARGAELLRSAGLAGAATPAELEALAGVYRTINSLWRRCAWES